MIPGDLVIPKSGFFISVKITNNSTEVVIEEKVTSILVLEIDELAQIFKGAYYCENGTIAIGWLDKNKFETWK